MKELAGAEKQTMPHKTGYIQVQKKGYIRLVCPGSFIKPAGTGKSEIIVLCQGATTFLYNKIKYDFYDFGCNAPIESTVQTVKKIEGTCPAAYEKYGIGFEIGAKKEFLPIIDICFDKTKARTIYTHHIARQFSKYGQTIARIPFKNTMFPM